MVFLATAFNDSSSFSIALSAFAFVLKSDLSKVVSVADSDVDSVAESVVVSPAVLSVELGSELRSAVFLPSDSSESE